MEMPMDGSRPKWTNVAGDRRGRTEPKREDAPENIEKTPKAKPESIAKDILIDPKKALYFTSMVRVMLEDRAYAVGRTGRAELQFGAPVSHYALESALAKLEVLAHDPAEDTGKIAFNDEEWQALVPAFARFQEASAAVAQMDTFFPDAELMAVMDWAALQNQNWELSGLLAMPGARADGFFPEVMKTLAFIDPARFETIKNSFSVARRLAKSDQQILTRLRDLGTTHGIPEKNLIAMLDHDDWEQRLENALFERVSGKETVIARGVASARAKATVASLANGITAYRRHAEPRSQALAEITEGMVDLLGGPGLVRGALEQVAFKPNASPEAKAAYDSLRSAQDTVDALLKNPAQLDVSLRTLAATNPRDWANRADPAASDRLAQSWLDTQYQSQLGGPLGPGAPRGGEGGEFWARLWQFLASFLGTAYGRSEMRSVSSRIQGL